MKVTPTPEQRESAELACTQMQVLLPTDSRLYAYGYHHGAQLACTLCDDFVTYACAVELWWSAGRADRTFVVIRSHDIDYLYTHWAEYHPHEAPPPTQIAWGPE